MSTTINQFITVKQDARSDLRMNVTQSCNTYNDDADTRRESRRKANHVAAQFSKRSTQYKTNSRINSSLYTVARSVIVIVHGRRTRVIPSSKPRHSPFHAPAHVSDVHTCMKYIKRIRNHILRSIKRVSTPMKFLLFTFNFYSFNIIRIFKYLYVHNMSNLYIYNAT